MQKSIEYILNKINANGFNSYVVGGYPRDILLSRKSNDIDICTSATPKELKEIFPSIKLPKLSYGSVTIMYNNIRFEITTYRTEKNYDNFRNPSETLYTDDVLLDLNRRDFTINSLLMDAKGEIIDFLNSKQDINNKIIRMIGDPKVRLMEDALRILRAIRFATVLSFEICPELKKSIKEYGYLLKEISYERKKEELDKIFASSNNKYGIKLLLEFELDKHLELSNLDQAILTSQIIGIWAQLNVVNIYKFNSYDYSVIKKINEFLQLEINPINVYNYGLFISSIVGEIKGYDRRKIAKIHSSLIIRSRKDIVFKSLDICTLLNKKEGPYLKEIISSIEKEIVLNNLKNDYNEIKNYILVKYM